MSDPYQPNWRTVVFLWLYAFEHPDYQHRPPTKRRRRINSEQPNPEQYADQPNDDRP